MKHPVLVSLLVTAFSAAAAFTASAQENLMPDLFSPVGKYLASGDCERLAYWFADNLDLEVKDESTNCSRNQARLILKGFFDENPPSGFKILHKSTKESLRYAIGQLTAGGESYNVVIYIKSSGGKNFVEHLAIRRAR